MRVRLPSSVPKEGSNMFTMRIETPAMEAARIAQEQQQAQYEAQLQAQQTQYPMGQYQATTETVVAYITQER